MHIVVAGSTWILMLKVRYFFVRYYSFTIDIVLFSHSIKKIMFIKQFYSHFYEEGKIFECIDVLKVEIYC